METPHPLLSIIVPVFNRPKSLGKLLSNLALDIIEGSFEKTVEIIIIDDASDNPIRIPSLPCKAILQRNDTNKGAPLSRQRGFNLSKAKFVHFHDSDDLIVADWLQKLIQTLIDNPKTDLLLTGRVDREPSGDKETYKKYFHRNFNNPKRIYRRLQYWNCIGPIGGVVFSQKILKKTPFRDFSSSQDWQMYLEAVEQAQVLVSKPDIQFLFNKTGSDRISHNERKKILGFLQYAHLTEERSIFKRSIRLFYLFRCRQQIASHGGMIRKFYDKNFFKIILTYLIVSTYSFLR